MRIFILNFFIGIFSSDDTEFILRFPAVAITHGFSQMRPVRSLQIPLRLEKVPQISQIYTDFSWDVFLSRRFRRWRRFFLMGFYHRTTRNLFWDFLLWRLLTDFRRCDLSGRCRYPWGWKKSHRFHRYTQIFLGTFFKVTQISQMTQIFFIHRMTRNLFGDFLRRQLLTDFHGGDLSGRCRYPLELEYVPQRKICVICEICGTK